MTITLTPAEVELIQEALYEYRNALRKHAHDATECGMSTEWERFVNRTVDSLALSWKIKQAAAE